MSLASFCSYAAKENIRLAWRARMNKAGSLYRIELAATVSEHVGQSWTECFPADQPLGDALDAMSANLHKFYRELIGRHQIVE